MISFKVLSEENSDEIISSCGCEDTEFGELTELVYSLDLTDPDLEFALSYSHGCALVRVFDMGRYSFIYPFPLAVDADTAAAIDDISEYAMREEIGLVVDDVPRERIRDFLSFRHINIDAADLSGDYVRITVKTECELCGDIPETEAGRVKLNELTEEDIPEYARLVKDENVNKYWGYSYSEDVSDPTDDYFYEMTCYERSLGISLSMAIRYNETFIGEAVLYAFDGRGNAEFALRLLPEWQGRGLGSETVLAIKDVARDIGLITLRPRVMKENEASLKMLSKLSDSYYSDGDKQVFCFDLYEEDGI